MADWTDFIVKNGTQGIDHNEIRRIRETHRNETSNPNRIRQIGPSQNPWDGSYEVNGGGGVQLQEGKAGRFGAINKLAGPVGELPGGDLDPNFVPEHRQLSSRLGPVEKPPLRNSLMRPIGKIGALGALPMPGAAVGALQDDRNPQLGWREKMIRFLGRSAGLDVEDPNAI
jgi:hypothetical protein